MTYGYDVQDLTAMSFFGSMNALRPIIFNYQKSQPFRKRVGSFQNGGRCPQHSGFDPATKSLADHDFVPAVALLTLI